jgi:glycosyltransferase involved in cell wall biosynthesis
MTQPDVSFILPTFNVESYLSDCLESILAQQCSKEILIINDGSTDGSLNIAKQYQQKYPFITIVNQSNKGVSSARNVGLRLAQGRYTAFVDPDDELETRHLADLIHQADQEKVDILRGQVLLFNQDLEIDNLVPTRLENIDPHRGKLVSGIQYFFALSSHFWFPTIWNGFYRTEFLHRYNLSFRDGFRCGEDNLFVLETLLAPAHVRVLEVNDIFYRYKLREGSLCTTQANLTHIIDVFKIAKIMLD